MPIDSINTGLAGLQAASTRLANSANNVANQSSTSRNENGVRVEEPFTPRDVHQISVEPSGVRAELRDREDAYVPRFDPDHPQADENGLVQYPNVNLEEEVVQQKFATYDFNANLKTIEKADERLKNLLDILS